MKIPLKKFTPQPLRRQMMILLIIMAVTMAGIMIFSIFSYYKLQYQSLKTNQNEKVNQVLHEVQYNYTYFSKLTTSLAYNELVQSYLIENKEESKFDYVQRVSNLLINTQNQEPSIIDIAVIGDNGNFSNVAGDSSITSKLLQELPRDQHDVIFFDRQNYFIHSLNTVCIVAGRLIYPLDLSNATPCGAVFVAIEPSRFLGGSYSLDSADQKMIFLDQSKNLLLGDEEIYQAFLSKKSGDSVFTYSNTEYTFETHAIPETGYELISIIPKGALIQKLIRTVGSQYFLTLVIFIVVCSFLIYFISRFFNTISELTGIMNKITSGNRRALKERIHLDEQSYVCLEATAIGNAFNQMLDEVDTLNRDIFNTCTKMYETEIYAKKTELAFLRSQINPHFLYNTLALICGMSTEGRSDDIINISQALAQILRYSIKGNEFVTFREELEIVKSYLMIQSTRFEGRFTIEYSISEEIMDACIPKMILQPLVENSIVHGLEKLLEPGHLQIGGVHDASNDTLVIWVYDTGEGISSQRLCQIRENLNHPKTIPTSMEESLSMDASGEDSDSLGLLNVNSRIRLYYGEPYHLIIESKEHIETNIQIRIPFQQQRKEE